jgi:ParB-like chromosome segregation protein Spo0J
MVSPYRCILLSLRDIDVSESHRNVDSVVVKSIADSIKRLGLLQPISVRAEGNNRYSLIAGRHRLEATRLNGGETIRASVVSVDDVDARLWEISENLHRAELTKLERAEQIEEWRKLTAEKGGKDFSPTGGAQPHDTGVKATARELGIAPVEVRSAGKIASLTPEAKDAAREAGLDDNQSALLRVAGAPAKAQVEAVAEIVKAKAEKPKRKPVRGEGDDGTEPTPEEYRFAYFNRADHAMRFAFLPEKAPEPDPEMVDWAEGVIEAWVKLRDSLKERVDRPEAVAARAVAATKAADAERLKLLRERAKKNGYRLVKRGPDYRLVDNEGLGSGHANLDTLEWELDRCEGKFASQIYTACGMRLEGTNNSEAWLAANPGATIEDFERALPSPEAVERPEVNVKSELNDIEQKMARGESEEVDDSLSAGQPMAQHSAAAMTFVKKGTKGHGDTRRPDLAAFAAERGMAVSPSAAA